MEERVTIHKPHFRIEKTFNRFRPHVEDTHAEVIKLAQSEDDLRGAEKSTGSGSGEEINQSETVPEYQEKVQTRILPVQKSILDFDCYDDSTVIGNPNDLDAIDEMIDGPEGGLSFLNQPRSRYRSMLDFRLECYLQWKYRACPFLTLGPGTSLQ